MKTLIESVIWDQSNWTITSAGLDVGGVWLDNTTLKFDDYAPLGNSTPLFIYNDPAGMTGTAGNSVSFDIEIEPGATQGEIIFHFIDVNNNTIGTDYIYPVSGQTSYTVQQSVNAQNFSGLSTAKNYGDVTGGPTIVGFNIL